MLYLLNMYAICRLASNYTLRLDIKQKERNILNKKNNIIIISSGLQIQANIFY